MRNKRLFFLPPMRIARIDAQANPFFLGVRICTPFESICAYLHPFASIHAFFPEKKDCFIFLGWWFGVYWCWTTQPKSIPAAQKAEQMPTNADQKHESYR